MVRAYSFLFVRGKLARRSSSLMMVRASASMISATIGSRPTGRIGTSIPRPCVGAHLSLARRPRVSLRRLSSYRFGVIGDTAHCPRRGHLGRPRCRPKGCLTRSLTPARYSVQIGWTRPINKMLQGLPTDSWLPTAALALSCARRAQADRDSQTTNLGVRNSNLFGRAI